MAERFRRGIENGGKLGGKLGKARKTDASWTKFQTKPIWKSSHIGVLNIPFYSKSGYRNFQFCSALHFLGEKNIQTSSNLSNPKFSECCCSGQITPHFLLQSLCVVCSNSFSNNEGSDRPLNPGQSCSSCGLVVSKIIPTFQSLPRCYKSFNFHFCWRETL